MLEGEKQAQSCEGVDASANDGLLAESEAFASLKDQQDSEALVMTLSSSSLVVPTSGGVARACQSSGDFQFPSVKDNKIRTVTTSSAMRALSKHQSYSWTCSLEGVTHS